MKGMKVSKKVKLDIFKLLFDGLKKNKFLFEQMKRGLDCPSHYIPSNYKKLIDYFENGCDSGKDCDDCHDELYNMLLIDSNEI
jgi:hypothetical protein